MAVGHQNESRAAVTRAGSVAVQPPSGVRSAAPYTSSRGPNRIEQLSFELTASALAEQERALSGLRARAGTVLAAAPIAGSFFGAKTSHGSLDVLGVLAMVSFALCVGSAIWILLPHASCSPSVARRFWLRATIEACQM